MSSEVRIAANAGISRCLSRRQFLRLAAAGAGAAAFGCTSPTPTPTAPPQPSATPAPSPTQAPTPTATPKPFAAVTINGALYEEPYAQAVKEMLPQFEEKTGMKVNLDIMPFAVHNQRVDLELSAKGSAYDFVGITFNYSGRWIPSGWMTNLEEYLKDPSKTPADWDADDFAAGPMAPMKDDQGNRYGFPHVASAQIGCAARYDLVEKAGFNRMPETFAELDEVLAAVHDQDGVKAYVTDKLHDWHLPPYIMGYGGVVFRDPPNNLTPMLDTAEAIEAAEFYANLLRSYCPEGVLSYTEDQATSAQLQGRANFRYNAVDSHVKVGDPASSQTAGTVRYALMPGGPKGNFPGANAHGVGLPVGSRQKDAAWEFVKWMLGKEIMKKIAVEKGFSAPCRMSVIQSPEFKQRMTLNNQDVSELYVKVLQLAGRSGYMKYRMVPVFPQVGDKINKAVEAMVTGQLSATAAMKQAQQEAVADLKQAGIKVDPY